MTKEKNAYFVARSARLKERGMCVRCTKNKSVEGRCICDKCRSDLAAYREEILKNKVCPFCKANDIESGYRSCASCREVLRERKRRFVASNRANGLCPCGNTRREGRKLCAECSTNLRLRARNLRDSGRCSCGKPAAAGKRSCGGCLSRRLVHERKKRAAAVVSDSCRICLKERQPGRLICDRCRQMRNAAYARRIARGKCGRCGAMAVVGRTLCQLHLSACKQSSAEKRLKKKEGGTNENSLNLHVARDLEPASKTGSAGNPEGTPNPEIGREGVLHVEKQSCVPSATAR